MLITMKPTNIILTALLLSLLATVAPLSRFAMSISDATILS